MRWTRSVGMGALAAFVAAAGLTQPAVAENTSRTEPVIEDLGPAMTTVRNTQSTAGYWTDGRPVLYATSSQAEQSLRFSVIDIATGEQLDEEVVDEVAQSHHVTLGPDGDIYVAGWGPRGTLLRYDPDSGEMQNLGEPIPGDTVITRIVEGPDGLLYGGGHPSGEVFSFDTETDEVENLGVAVEGEQYARSLAYAPETNTLYVGTEGSVMHLVAIDMETGEKTAIPSPPWAQAETRHYDLAYADGLLFSYTSPSLDWHVYDVEAGEWIDQVVGNAQGGMTRPDENGDTYFVNLTDHLMRYDIDAQQASPVGWSQSLTSAMGAAGISLIDLQDADWPGETVVGLGSRGDLWLWNPATGEGEVRQTESPEFPVTIRSLGRGFDERIYVGGSSGGVTVSAYDTAAEEFVHFTRGPSARVDAWAHLAGKVYFTTYPQAAVWEYDPAEPYVWGRNPHDLFGYLSELHQERIYAFEVVDESSFVVGTIGGRDINTGLLVHYDVNTGTRTDLGAPIDGLSIASLTHTGDYLIGGTSIEVLGGESPHPEARLFVWDLTTHELVWDGAPIPGARDFGEVIVDDDGLLWGLTSQGIVFAFDLDTKQVVGSATVGRAGGIWGHGSLEFGADGLLYGSTADGEVFVLDPETFRSKVLAVGEHAVFDDQGRLYFGDLGHLYRLTPESEPFPPDTEAPVIEPIPQTKARAGEQVEIQVVATDESPLTYAASGLPAGLEIDESGLISGVPARPGASNVTVTVTDAAGNTDEERFLLVVTGPPVDR